jgi:hypothetical protein
MVDIMQELINQVANAQAKLLEDRFRKAMLVAGRTLPEPLTLEALRLFCAVHLIEVRLVAPHSQHSRYVIAMAGTVLDDFPTPRLTSCWPNREVGR